MGEAREMIGRTVLGRYRIVTRLARGGMGVVFLARAEGAAGFAKPVVVKRTIGELSGDDTVTRLFIREARILSNLQHPGIVSILDFGLEDDAYIMVLDYVRAYNIAHWHRYLKETGELFPVGIAVYLLVRVLEALEYAHKLALPDGTPLGIVHADISPSNVLVDTEGHVKIVDFGIARMMGESITRTGESPSIKGKFGYMPPESFSGATPDPRTDVYACGVVLYELLTGEPPFRGKDMNEIVARVILQEAEPVTSKRPDATAELDTIVARAMAKDRRLRYASAGEFAGELRRVRSISDEAAHAALAALAKRDFPESLPQRRKLVPLQVLDEKWRDPQFDPPPSSGSASAPASARPSTRTAPEPKFPSDAPTRGPSDTVGAADSAATVKASAGAPARKEHALRWVVTAAVIALALGAGVALVRRSSREEQAPHFIVVERQPAASASAGAPLEPSTGATAPESSVAAASSASAAGGLEPTHVAPGAATHAAAGSTDPLSAAFARKEPQIEGCFRDNAVDINGNPQLSVRFSVDRTGRVQQTELSPPELATTALGRCILDVARATTFPAQASPIAFRIPLRAQHVR